MLTVVTNRDSNHLTPNVDPVPIGTIDLFGRDDGWIGDRPADCGNFWLDRANVEDPAYLSGGAAGKTPGLTSFLSSIWLGGTDVAVQFDATTGPDLSSSKGVLCYLVGAGRPEFAGDEIIMTFRTDQTIVSYLEAGVLVDAAFGPGSAASTTYRFYLSATVSGSDWRIRVDRSATDGSGRVRLADVTVPSSADVGWLSFATSASMSGVTIDNLQRIATFGPALVFSDAFTRADSTTTLGSPWTAYAGTWGILSNHATLRAIRADGQNVAAVDAGLADIELTVTLTHVEHGGAGMGACVRLTDGNNYLFVEAFAATSQVEIWRNQAGTFSRMAQSAVTSAWLDGDVLTIVTSGTGISVKRNGVTMVSTSSAFNQTATKHGLRAASFPGANLVELGLSTWDDFTLVG